MKTTQWMAMAIVLLLSPMAGADESCDRNCITGEIQTYVSALVNHGPSNLPLSADLRSTENGLKPGEAIWQTITRQGG